MVGLRFRAMPRVTVTLTVSGWTLLRLGLATLWIFLEVCLQSEVEIFKAKTQVYYLAKDRKCGYV